MSPNLSIFPKLNAFIHSFIHSFIERERERERERVGGAETEIQNLKEAPGSELSAQSPT